MGCKPHVVLLQGLALLPEKSMKEIRASCWDLNLWGVFEGLVKEGHHGIIRVLGVKQRMVKILNRPEVVILDLVEQKERCVRLGLFSSSLRHRPVCLQADPHLTVSLLRQSLQAWASFCQRRISSATCHRRSGGSSRHLDSYMSLLSSCGHCRGLCRWGRRWPTSFGSSLASSSHGSDYLGKQVNTNKLLFYEKGETKEQVHKDQKARDQRKVESQEESGPNLFPLPSVLEPNKE